MSEYYAVNYEMVMQMVAQECQEMIGTSYL